MENKNPVDNSPSLDKCEQPVRGGLGRISVNARPICIMFVGIESYLATCEQNRKSIQILVNAIPIR